MKFSITQIIRRVRGFLLNGSTLARDFVLEMVFPRSGIARDLEKMGADEALARLHLCGVIESGVVGGVGEIFAVFQYRNALVRRMIWELKYRGNKKVARLCAGVLSRVIFENFPYTFSSPMCAPILIPIPLTRARRRERGFNQNELVIEEIMKINTEKSFSFSFDALVKIRGTAPQSSIKNRAERLKNLNGCFAVTRSELVTGKNIILIDDVVTTGSTLTEARNALIVAGALSVQAIAIAH